MSIAKRILILILIPLAAIIGFAGMIVLQRAGTVMTMAHLTTGGSFFIRSIVLSVRFN